VWESERDEFGLEGREKKRKLQLPFYSIDELLALSEKERAKVLSTMSQEQKVEIFKRASDEQRLLLFKEMSDIDKKEISRVLDEKTRMALFKSVEYEDKLLLFNAMERSDQSEWLRRYPGLEFFLKKEDREPFKLGKKETDRDKKKLKDRDKKKLKEEEVPELSDIEKILSGEFPTEISRELKQYGYDFFKDDNSSFAPIDNMPVGPDYVLGAGDSFTINLWGKTEVTHKVTVARNGMVTIPRLGAIQVSGMKMDEMAKMLLSRFQEYYADCRMDISMSGIRTVDVFIVGEVKYPGTYSVSSVSTIITSLYAAGGPNKKGSMRSVFLMRNGKTVAELDLYEFLIGGNKSADVRVEAGDTIYVPVLGPVVGVAGFVKRPAIYEMKSSQSVRDVIHMSGGTLALSHLQNVVIERIQDHKRRVVRSFDLKPTEEKSDRNMDMPLEDGDVIKIYPVHEKLRQVVYLEGHVKYPREYELKPGMRLRDLIPSYEDLLPEPYLQQGEIVRLVPPDLRPKLVEFNLASLLNGDQSQNLELQDMDRVIIYDAWEKKDRPEVTIKGAVRTPGTYRLYRDMTVKDLIFRAGNLTDKAYQEDATLTRIAQGEKKTDTIRINFSPGNAMSGLESDNLALQKDDSIYITEIPNYAQSLERKVTLEGEFVFPGEYTFKEGERLQSVIQRAGGLTQDAYAFGAVFQREAVKKVQDEQLKSYVSKLEEDILTISSQAASTAMDKDQAAIMTETLQSKKQLLDKLKASKSTGRMVINLEEAMLLASSKYNIEMRPGDRLLVNKKPDSVNVLGEVYNPTAIVYEMGQDIGHYLDLVGGPTGNADKGQIYVVRANGSVISKEQEKFFGLATWDSKQHRWTVGSFNSMELDPGDTVLVPKKVEKYPWLRVIKDVTQIAYQVAVAAGIFFLTD